MEVLYSMGVGRRASRRKCITAETDSCTLNGRLGKAVQCSHYFRFEKFHADEFVPKQYLEDQGRSLRATKIDVASRRGIILVQKRKRKQQGFASSFLQINASRKWLYDGIVVTNIVRVSIVAMQSLKKTMFKFHFCGSYRTMSLWSLVASSTQRPALFFSPSSATVMPLWMFKHTAPSPFLPSFPAPAKPCCYVEAHSALPVSFPHISLSHNKAQQAITFTSILAQLISSCFIIASVNFQIDREPFKPPAPSDPHPHHPHCLHSHQQPARAPLPASAPHPPVSPPRAPPQHP